MPIDCELRGRGFKPWHWQSYSTNGEKIVGDISFLTKLFVGPQGP